MVAERISQQRHKEIAAIAHDLWFGFVDSHGERFKDLSLFDTESRINPTVMKFLRHCVEVYTDFPGSSAGVVYTRFDDPTAPSWLWSNGREKGPWVVIDNEKIGNTVRVDEERKILTRIILHEIGHIVLHFCKILKDSVGAVKSANDNQEEEAWIFCFAVIGASLGEAARKGRELKITDRAWNYSC